MTLKERLFSNMFVRNMLADLTGRSAYSTFPGTFTPYFQYKIGQYQQDYYLYFPKEPFAKRYINEIFNKIYEYNGYDIIKYLEFHYSRYQDSQEFIVFLLYEISERLKLPGKKARKLKLQSALTWVNEKREELKEIKEAQIRKELELSVHSIVKKQQEADPQALERLIKEQSDKLITNLEKSVLNLTSSFTTGNIQLNNRNHEEKLIQLFIMLQGVQAPPEKAKAEQLFKKFSGTDIAALLHLHFDAFKDKKINTLQKMTGEFSERLNTNNPKVKNLNDALQEFFYQ